MKIKSKHLSKIVISVIIIFSVVFSFNTSAFAESIIISQVETKRIANVPAKNYDKQNFYNIGGIAIGKKKNSMFVVKSTDAEDKAAFYYYPDIEKPTNYAIFRLNYAGHANAMAINSSNVFVAGWVNEAEHLNENNRYNNWILMIPRKTISGMPFNKEGEIIKKDNKNTAEIDGYYVLHPKIKHIAADGKVTYTDYNRLITSISKYKDDNSFIINYCSKWDRNDKKAVGDYSGEDFRYAFAKLEKDVNTGKPIFVVSEKNKFVIKNNLQDKNSVGQDICYSEGNGFFAPLWGGNKGSAYYNKNVILWANIDKAPDSTVTINGESYKCFIPKEINVNKSSEKGYGVTKYALFEIESIAFTEDNRMLFSCNIEHTKDYKKAYEKKNKKLPANDGIFELTHDHGKKFML